ncbi:MAG: MaoC family dehydratase [Parvibaculaceae bacterium]
MSKDLIRIGDLTLDEFRSRIGDELGVSDWLTVTQKMIDMFGEATLDPDPMHTDPDWCEEHSPFKMPIAFGFMTLSLLMYLLHDVMKFRSVGANAGGHPQYGLNYGFDRVRLMSPVPVNARIRGRFVLADIKERNPGEFLQIMNVTVEVEGQSKPALVAQWLSIFVSEEGHQRVSTIAAGK